MKKSFRSFFPILIFLAASLFSSGTTQAASCDTSKVTDHFTLVFEGVTYNYEAGTSKWDYTLNWDGKPPALSYFFIELCSLLTDENLVAAEPNSGSIGYNGNAKLYGIKWDGISGFPANTPVSFSFTLDQLLLVDHTQFAPKAGVNQNLATICGPSLDCETITDSCAGNSPPSVECPGDTTIVVNSLSEICLDGFAAFDVDGNILSITATGGTFGNGRVCFVPVEGGNVITFVAIDSCGAADTCQTNVFVRRNNPPICQLPPENSVIEICAGQDTCLRVSALDPDNNLERCSIIDGPGQIVDDTLWCNTPSGNETVTVTIECVDSLGLACTGQFTVEFRIGQKPELGEVNVTDVFLCNSQQPVCVELDINSFGLGFEVSTHLGEFNPADSSVCFSADTSGTYYNRVILTNSCGQADSIEYVIDVVINSAPVAVCPPIDTIEICYTQEQVCVAGFDYFDNNDNIVSVDLIGGNFVGDSVCFNPLIGENNLTLVVTDNCGLVDTCRTLVFVKASSPPVIPPIDDQEVSICNPDTFCFDLSVIEPVNNLDSVWTNIGEINNGVLCVSVDTSGIYQVVVYAMNKCLEISSDSFKVFVTINEPPLVSLGEDFSREICGEDTICVGFSVIESYLTDVTSNYPIIGNQVCFSVDTSGVYLVWVRATDRCETTSADSILVTVSTPPAPFVDLGNDIAVTSCTPSQYCIEVFTIANPVSVTFNHEGYNPETREFCFAAEQTFHDMLKVEVVDSCGRIAMDSISVMLHINTPPLVETPLPDTTLYMCRPEYVCLDLNIIDYDYNIASVQVNHGSYSNGQICFVPYDSGNYTIIATATDSCGATVSDTAVVRIITDQFVNLECPNDTTVFMCQHDTLCFPIGEIPEWAQVQVTGINTWFDRENQQVCFYVECGVSNRITVKAITDCDTISCSFTVDVVCNQPPVVFLPPDTSIELCGPDSIYIPVGINDPNHNLHSVNTSSWTVFEPISSRISFYPDTSGLYLITVTAYDSCEASASDQIRVQVILGEAQACATPNDTAIYLCQPGQISVPIYNPNDSHSVSNCTLVESPGQIVNGNWVYQANSSQIVNVVVQCIDDCENICRDTFTVDIQINEAPICSLPNDTTVFLCQQSEICLPVSATDNDGNYKSCSILRGPGSFPDNSGKITTVRQALALNSSLQWCYTATKDTSFYVVIQCEDSCGASCIDSFYVEIDLNEAPIVSCPGDTSLTVCSLSPISIGGFTAIDPDGNLISGSVSNGELSGSTVTFTPVEGENVIIYSAFDECQASDACTTYVNVNLNQPPVCQVPNDTTITGCAENEICLPVGAVDVDGNLSSCEIVSGPGVLEGGFWCYSPLENGTFKVIISCTDSCGASCTDSFTVNFDAGTLPSIADQYFSYKYCDELIARVIQVESSQSGSDPNIFELLTGFGSIDSLSGVITYFPDTPGVYSFLVEVFNSCGSDSAIVRDTIKINRPPDLAGFDSTVNLCQVQEICFDVFGFDTDGDSLEIMQIVGPGLFTQNTKNTGTTCFTPVKVDSAVTYLFVYQVTDLCSSQEGPYEYYFDTVAITVILDKAPTLEIPPFFSIFACSLDSACFPIPAYDPEEFPYEVEILSGNAVIYGDSVACLLIDGAGDYVVTIKVTDSCGNSSTYSSTINVEINTPPIVTLDEDFALELCAAQEVCFNYSVFDADNNIELISANYGEVTGQDSICFNADTSGVYQIIVTVADSCGAIDSDTINVSVDINQTPIIDLGPDHSRSVCLGDTICVLVQVQDDNLDGVFSNYAVVDNNICFAADSSGRYVVYAQAIDSCEIEALDSVVINVTTLPAPFVDLGEDIRAKICSSTEFCIDVNTIPNPVSVEFNRVGYNPETGQFCWTANGTILDLLKVTVTDSCGRTATDSISVYIQFNTAPTVQTAMRDTTIYMCRPAYVCLPVVFADSQNNIASITVNRGQYANGQVCFVPYDSGNYTVIATATDSCGAVIADTAVVRILTDQFVDLDCPNDTTVFMCEHDTLCFPIGDIPEWAQIQVTGINTWYNAQTQEICFYVSCGVRNRIVVKAITPCDTISCSFTVTVRCNQPPLVLLPQDTTVAICAPDTVYIPIGTFDANGNIQSITTNSWAFYEPITSRIGFVADTTGVYVLQATVTDSCGQTDFEDIKVTVTFNSSPQIAFGPADSIYSLCVLGQICLPVTVTDPNNNIAQVVTSIGNYNSSTGQICFTPADTFGLYCVRAIVTDICGLADTAVKCITIINEGIVNISCPTGPIFDTLCQSVTICRDLSIVGEPDSIKASYGNIQSGQLCFAADTTGRYLINVSVFSPCTTIVCQFDFRITLQGTALVSCPPNDTVLVCGPDTVFYHFSSSSVDTVSITPPAFISGDSIGIPVFSSSIFNLKLKGSGNCGADSCTFFVDARLNSKPTVVSARDTVLTDCVIQQFCVPFTVTDPDNNVVSIIGPDGPITGNQYCFTPTGSGDYRIIIRATDACGAIGVDTTNVRVSQTVADIFCPAGEQNRTVCRNDSVRITVPITPFEATVQVFLDGIANGYYNRDSALVIVYPTTPGAHIVRLIASAGCVTDTCNINLFVNFLERTNITCPSVIDTFVCPVEVDSICFPITVVGTAVQVSVSNGGKYANGTVCVPVSQEGALNVRIIGTGACGVDTCYTTINITADDPPLLYLPADTVIELCDYDSSLICIKGIFVEDEASATLSKVCGPGDFQLITPDSGIVCFYPSGAFFGDYIFCFEVNDGCNTRVDSFKVTINEAPRCDECLVLSIDGGECIPVGRLHEVDLKIETFRSIGGFEILLSFDASVVSFASAEIGGTEIDGWEYFNYRLNSAACSPVCPTGIIRLIGLAETNNGAQHPPIETLDPNGVLVKLYFHVTNDQNVGGQFLPINFVTYECQDNTVSDPTGNDLLVDSKIYNAENHLIWDEENNTTYPESVRPRGLGTPDSCIAGVGKGTPKRCVEFINGGICTLHPDEIDDRGDINLNGISYEVADAVVFTNYFIYGFAAFTVNIAGQIAATDVNADGIALSVADLVLLLRVIIGDADPLPKINPHETALELINTFENGKMTVNSESINGIGAAYLVYDLSGTNILGEPELTGATRQMDMRSHIENNELRILIYSMSGKSIQSGAQTLISIPFEGSEPQLAKFDFADAEGRSYNVANKTFEMPDGFVLDQNYPNPFNPSTTLSFGLPKEAKWHLTIFNVNGATVRRFTGSDLAGRVEVVWDGRADDGSDVSSGVYFYRLEAGAFVATKKMMMLK